MTGATFFSGIHAAELAMPWVDWKWCADIEPLPVAVGSYRHPNIPNLGDVTDAKFIDTAKRYGPVELFVFGSPCQSFSVAGRRLGLDDARGNLALVALGVIAALAPRWFVFENVPGLLSSGSGADLAAFLREVEKLGYSCAWRVLDAAYFGVPQRRRRFFLVANSRDWRAAAAVLSEREGVQRRHTPRTPKGPRPATPANASARLRSFWEQLVAAFGEGETSAGARVARQICEPVAPTLPGRSKRSGQLGSDFDYDGGVIGVDIRNNGLTGDVSHTLQTKPNGDQSLNSTPTVMTMQAIGEYADCGVASSAKARDHKDATDLVCSWTVSEHANGYAWTSDIAPTIQATPPSDGMHQQYGVIVPQLADPLSTHEQGTYTHEGRNNFRLRNVVPVMTPGETQRRRIYDGSDTAPCLSAEEGRGHGIPSVIAPVAWTQNTRDEVREIGGEVAGCLGAEEGMHQRTYVAQPVAYRKATRPHGSDDAERWEASDVANTLNPWEERHDPPPHLVAYGMHAETTPKIGEEIMPTLRSRETAGGSMDFVAFSMRGREEGIRPEIEPEGLASVRSASGGSTNSYVAPVAFQDRTETRDLTSQEDLAYTVRNPGKGGRRDANCIALPEQNAPCCDSQPRGEVGEGFPVPEVVRRLPARPGASQAAVRRLTPVEAARLQGFPDTWCHIPWKRRRIDLAEARYYVGHGLKVWQEGSDWYTDVPCDGPIYRAFGNSMAVPVMRWLGNRIREVDTLMEER